MYVFTTAMSVASLVVSSIAMGVLLVPSWCQGEVARIVNQPQFMIIPLNTIQKYSCSGIATFINWEVNNMSIDAEQRAKGFDDTGDTILDEQISNLRTRELAVDGNSETNNSMIVCFAVLLSPPSSTFAASNSVQVLVLDNLDRSESVNNLTVTHLNSTAFFISWTAPFIVEGLPIHGYNVTISNTFNGQSLTFFVENTALVYVIDNPDPNDDFTVTVFPINAVGPGEFVVIQVPKFVFSTTALLPTSFVSSTAILTTYDLSMLPSASSSPSGFTGDLSMLPSASSSPSGFTGDLSMLPSASSSPSGFTGGNLVIIGTFAIIVVLIITMILPVFLIISLLCYRKRKKHYVDKTVGMTNPINATAQSGDDTQSQSSSVEEHGPSHIKNKDHDCRSLTLNDDEVQL